MRRKAGMRAEMGRKADERKGRGEGGDGVGRQMRGKEGVRVGMGRKADEGKGRDEGGDR